MLRLAWLAMLALLAPGIARAAPAPLTRPTAGAMIRVCDVSLGVTQGGAIIARNALTDAGTDAACTGTMTATPRFAGGYYARQADTGNDDNYTSNGSARPVAGGVDVSAAIWSTADNAYAFTYQTDSSPALGAATTDTFLVIVYDTALAPRAYVYYHVTVSPVVVVGTPTANSQSVNVGFNTATAITLTGSDPNTPARPLTYTVATAPTHGTLSGTAPNLTYTPTANYSGTDSFTFTASNGTNTSNTATVSIAVAPGTPTANSQSVTTAANTATAITLTASDPDSPARPLTYTVAAAPTHGTLSGTAPNLTYTPSANYSGMDSFTFRASNGTNTSNTATVAITVRAPVTLTPTTLPNGTVGVLYTRTFSATGGSGGYTYAVAGTLPPGLTLAGNTLSGTPTMAGSYSFTVTVTDGSTPTQSDSRNYTLVVDATAVLLPRTWVSSDGDDAADCSRAAPCATFAAAFAKVATGGTVNCVDNGAYGTLTIDRAVSIVCGDKVGRAGVIVSGNDAIVVAAPAGAAVLLSGLDVEGLGNTAATAGSYGVRFTGGGSLVIRDSTIRSVRGTAVSFEPNASASLDLHDVAIADSGAVAGSAGVLVRPSAGTARLTASGLRVTGGQQAGIRLDASAAGTQVAATIVRSGVSDNAGTGVLSTGSGGTVRTAIVGSTVAGNTVGVATTGTGSVTVIGDSTITRNAVGIAISLGANAATAGDNTLTGNTADGAFTMSAANQ